MPKPQATTGTVFSLLEVLGTNSAAGNEKSWVAHWTTQRTSWVVQLAIILGCPT